MKILVVHSYYQQKGGEDAVFRNEQVLLQDPSVTIRTLEFQNQTGVKGAKQFLLSVWNVTAARKLKKVILEYRPDIIHLHNFHFAIGPVAVRVAKRAHVPIVLTVHNYRLLCPSATLLYKGNLFTESLHAPFPWKAIQKKVYRDSFLETFWLAFVIGFHKRAGTWKMVDRYIMLTDFARDLFVHSSFGPAPDKYVVKSNFKNRSSISPLRKGNHFLFVGRLSEEKGIRVLLEAFTLCGYELHIAGEGPLEKEVLESCKKNANIKFLGSLDNEAVERAMQHCTALIFPSVWYEGMPMTIIEAFASGTPVIASNLGAMSSLIRNQYNGLHFKAGDAEDLAEKLHAWCNLTGNEREGYRKNAADTYESHYTPEKNKKLLINIYKSIMHAKAAD